MAAATVEMSAGRRHGAAFYAGPDRRCTAQRPTRLGRPFAVAALALVVAVGAAIMADRLPAVAVDQAILTAVAATAAATASVTAGVLCLGRYSTGRERTVLDSGAVLVLAGLGGVLPATVGPLLASRHTPALHAAGLGAAAALVVASLAIARRPAVDERLRLSRRLAGLLASGAVAAFVAFVALDRLGADGSASQVAAGAAGLAAGGAAVLLLVVGYRRRNLLLAFVGLDLLGVQAVHVLVLTGPVEPRRLLAGSWVALAAALIGLAGAVLDDRASFHRQQRRLFDSWIEQQVAYRREADLRAIEEERFHDLRAGLLGVEAFLRTVDLQPSSVAVLSELDRLRQLVSHPTAGPELFDLAAPVRALVATRAQDGITIEAPTSLPVVAHRAELLEAVQNLVDNAVRHAPGSPVQVRLGESDGSVEVVVADHGPGIPAERLALVGQRGYTTHPQGSGLGLYIVTNVVESMGGTVDLRSGADGVDVTVRLPIAATAERRPGSHHG